MMIRLAALVSITCVLAVQGELHENLVFLQRFAVKRIQNDLDNSGGEGGKAAIVEKGYIDNLGGEGGKAPITEKGYQSIAKLKNDREMQTFIRRLLYDEARYVKYWGLFRVAVPFHSGTRGVQNLTALKNEIRHAAWAGSGQGRTATLDEDGYQKVAQLYHKGDMTAFIRRLLSASGRRCTDEKALAGLVRYYDGEISIQNFDALQKELLDASWVQPYGSD